MSAKERRVHRWHPMIVGAQHGSWDECLESGANDLNSDTDKGRMIAKYGLEKKRRQG